MIYKLYSSWESKKKAPQEQGASFVPITGWT